MKLRTKDMIECSLFTALLCIFGSLAIPIGAVPVTMAIFAVLLSSVVLGYKKAVASVSVYIFLGIIGFPVFSCARSGLPIILGPTGGYVWSYVFMALISGIFSQKVNKESEFAISLLGSFISLAVCYVCGTIQFAILNGTGIYETLAACVLPFAVFDVIKCVFAVWLGLKIRKNLPYRS